MRPTSPSSAPSATPVVGSADDASRRREAERFARDVLPAVSRTFAISIRLLPGELGLAVTVAYLLCRIADTIEDDGQAEPAHKQALLQRFLLALEDKGTADGFGAECASLRGDPAHLRLVGHTGEVCLLLRGLSPRTQQHVRHWVGVMVRGMHKFVGLYPRGIRIQTVAEYREYCYYVAGTVGCMLTELWREHGPGIGQEVYQRLWKRCEQFGEALQTVNILKDIAVDAEVENSIYIPAQSLAEHGSSHETLLSAAHREHNHKAVAEFIDLAWHDLDEALEYICTLPRRAFRIRAFCVLPLLFAYATLRDLTRSRAMLERGGTVKISRAEVKSLMVMGLMSLFSNSGLRRLVAKVKERPYTLAPLALGA